MNAEGGTGDNALILLPWKTVEHVSLQAGRPGRPGTGGGSRGGYRSYPVSMSDWPLSPQEFRT